MQLHEFEVILRFGDWNYLDTAFGDDVAETFGDNFNQLWGREMDCVVLKYDAAAQQWILESRSGVVGDLGVRIMDYELTLQEYQEIMAACESCC